MFQALYHMFLFFILLCLRGWELPAEMAKSFSLRSRLSDVIAGSLMGTNDEILTSLSQNDSRPI